MHLRLERYASPIDPLLLVTDEAGTLRMLDFGGNDARMHRLLRTYYSDYSLEEGTTPREITRALDDYFAGDIRALDDVPVATTGTPFQRSVWQALRTIPYGTTQSYGQLAARLGRPAASRAVGAANGANPIGIVVPCHRVIGANGSLTGFGGGLPRKKWLLAHERKHSAAGNGARHGGELALATQAELHFAD